MHYGSGHRYQYCGLCRQSVVSKVRLYYSTAPFNEESEQSEQEEWEQPGDPRPPPAAADENPWAEPLFHHRRGFGVVPWQAGQEEVAHAWIEAHRAEPDTRFYAVWQIAGDTTHAGVHGSVGSRYYDELRRGHDHRQIRWRRFPTLAEALVGYAAEARRWEAPLRMRFYGH